MSKEDLKEYEHDHYKIDDLEEGETVHEGTMGWFSGMCMIMGLMIGSGIFATPSKVAREVGSPGMSLVLWVIGGIVSLSGAFSYVELGCMMPQNGGEQAYLNAAYKKPRYLLSFLFCWCMVTIVRPGAAAADSTIFAEYMLFPFYGDHSNVWHQRFLGFGCITIITIMNIFSTKLAIWIHDAVTVFKLGTLALIAITGILVGFNVIPSIPKTDTLSNLFDNTTSNGGVYASTLFNIFYTYDGWNNLNYSVKELKDPKRNLPKAGALGVGTVVILYLVTNLAYMLVLPMADLQKAGPLLAATFFGRCFGPTFGGKVLPCVIGISAFGAVCAMVFSGARVIQSAAQANYLPFSSVFARVNPRTKTPVNALLLHYVFVVVLLFAPPPGKAFDLLVDVIGYPTWIFYGLAVAGLVKMRYTDPHLPRPYKVFIPCAFILIATSLFLAIFPFVPKESESYPFFLPPTIGVIFILSGVPLWWFLVGSKPQDQLIPFSPPMASVPDLTRHPRINPWPLHTDSGDILHYSARLPAVTYTGQNGLPE